MARTAAHQTNCHGQLREVFVLLETFLASCTNLVVQMDQQWPAAPLCTLLQVHDDEDLSVLVAQTDQR